MTIIIKKGVIQMNAFNNIIVTCVYCEHHARKYTSEKLDFIEANQGFCRKENKRRMCQDEICSFFKLKSGMHTFKWYPGKD